VLRFFEGDPSRARCSAPLHAGPGRWSVALAASSAGFARLGPARPGSGEQTFLDTATRRLPTPFPHSTTGAIGLLWSAGRRFLVVRNFRSFAREEDVDLSSTFWSGLTPRRRRSATIGMGWASRECGHRAAHTGGVRDPAGERHRAGELCRPRLGNGSPDGHVAGAAVADPRPGRAGPGGIGNGIRCRVRSSIWASAGPPGVLRPCLHRRPAGEPSGGVSLDRNRELVGGAGAGIRGLRRLRRSLVLRLPSADRNRRRVRRAIRAQSQHRRGRRGQHRCRPPVSTDIQRAGWAVVVREASGSRWHPSAALEPSRPETVECSGGASMKPRCLPDPGPNVIYTPGMPPDSRPAVTPFSVDKSCDSLWSSPIADSFKRLSSRPSASSPTACWSGAR